MFFVLKSTHNQLLEEKKSLEKRIDFLEREVKAQSKQIVNNAFDFRTRALIVGEMASGKTSLINNIILQQREDVFVVSFCSQEYDGVLPIKNLYSVSADFSRGVENTVLKQEIAANNKKLIVIDGFSILYPPGSSWAKVFFRPN